MGERSYKKGTTVSSEGITVHQLLTEEEFGVPSVVLKIASNREDTALVRLVVSNVEAERIGFHPDFRDESWSIDDGRLGFECEMEPGEEITTLYAVEAQESEAIEAAIDSLQLLTVESLESEADPLATGDTVFNGSPDTGEFGIERDPDDTLIDPDESAETEFVEAEASAEHTVAESDEQEGTETTETSQEQPTGTDDSPEKTLIDLEETGDTGAETTERVSEDEDVEFEHLSEESSKRAPNEEANDMANEDSSPATEHSTDKQLNRVSTTELVDELVARVEDQDLSSQHRHRLQSAGLIEEDGRDGVKEAQIAHLQSRMSDIETFTESIEQLFERHGPPAQLFDEYEGKLDQVQRQLEAVSDEVETTAEAVDGVEPRLQAVEEEVDGVDEELASMNDDLETVKRNQEVLESDMRNLKTWRKKVTGALEAFMGE